MNKPTLHFMSPLLIAGLLVACGSALPATEAAAPPTDQPADAAPTDPPATDAPVEPSATLPPAVFVPDSDPALAPLDLSAGFWPDPASLAVVGGGPVDTSLSMDGCAGYAPAVPTVRVHYEGFGFLRFFFVSESADAAALIVRAPGDEWWCGSSAEVAFEEASSGDYEVWIAGSTPDTPSSGMLYVTELRRLDAAALRPAPTPAGPPGTALDPTAPAEVDDIPLPRQFAPDPLPVELVAGGNVNVPAAVSSLYCAGYASVEPDARFYWEGIGFLRFFFLPERGGDTALVVHAPDGSWWCIDDTYGTLDPSLDFLNSNPGEYAVWVSTDRPNEQVPGTLYVTAWDNHPGNFVPPQD